MTINGIGTRFYGVSRPAEDGTSTATLWFTFLYFPVIPISRSRILRDITDPRVFQYHVVEKLPLSFAEIIKTYFQGWVLMPLLIFGPMIFAVREVGEYFGYTNEHAEGTFYNFLIGFAIVWMIAVIWVWKSKDEKRGLPKSER